jgi:hypothetical protein
MPTIDLKAPRHQLLVKTLAGHLAHPPEPRFEPFVIESQVAQSKSLHVLVIWDKWDDVDRADRSRIVIDAYSVAKRLRGQTITMAMGLTQREALRMGFLRYKLLMALKKSDPVTAKDLALAYEAAGGVLEIVGMSAIRSFPTRESAEDGYRAAAAVAPGPYWIIEREVDPPEA